MGPIGLPEMMALFVIALLLFGPKKLPELGRTLGKGLSEFRRAKSELTATLESHMREIERETQLEKAKEAGQIESSSTYTYPYGEHGSYDPEPFHSEPVARELTAEQKAAVDANAASADPVSHGVPPLSEAPAGTVARSNGIVSVQDHHV